MEEKAKAVRESLGDEANFGPAHLRASIGCARVKRVESKANRALLFSLAAPRGGGATGANALDDLGWPYFTRKRGGNSGSPN